MEKGGGGGIGTSPDDEGGRDGDGGSRIGDQ